MLPLRLTAMPAVEAQLPQPPKRALLPVPSALPHAFEPATVVTLRVLTFSTRISWL